MQRKSVLVEEMMTSQKTCRLLFYGPADAGKRANLRYIHQSIPPEQRLPLATDDPERQIAFKVRHGDDGTWQVLVHAVDTGRERMRTGGSDEVPPFDGIVFVVDSRLDQLDQSLAAFESLKTYLDSYGLDLTEIPVVIQYNGREKAEVLPVDRMESLLNPWGLLSFPANSAKGEGVRETLKSVLGLTVSHLNQNPRPASQAQVFEPAVLDAGSGNDGTGDAVSDTAGLGIDYGPPIPGSEIGETTKALSDAIFEELKPPVVIPVKIPRRLLTGEGPVKILLEVEIDDSSDF
jgi:signal recognition particle receptor subunit beta